MSNPVISWTSLADSGGRKIRDYALHFDNGFLDVMGKIYTPITSIIWDFFMFLSALAATLVGWIGDPKWLGSLDGLYKHLTSSFLNAANPVVISVGGFGILMLYIVLDKAKTNSTRMDKNDANRIVAAVALMGFIALMVSNPFAILKDALSVVQVLVATIAGKDSTNLSVFSVDSMIRQPTLIINYNGAVSEKCADLWSKQGQLTDTSQCYTTAAASPETIILSILAFVMSLTACAFAVWALWKYVRHLSVAVLGFVSLSWVAAMSLFRRRQFDQLATVLAIAFGNLVMVLAVQVIAIGGPELVSKFMEDWGQSGYAVLQMLLLAAMYAVLLGMLVLVTNKHSALTRILKTDANNSLKVLGSPGTSKYANLDGKGMRAYWNDFRNGMRGASADKIVKGKAAEMGDMAGEGDVKDNLEDVQKTVRFDDAPARPPMPALSTNNVVSRTALTVANMADGRDITYPVEDYGPDILTPAEITVRAVSGVENELRDLGWASSDVRAPEPEAIRSLGVPLPDDVDDDALSRLGQAVIARNMILDDPEFGGLTPGDQISSSVATQLNDFMRHLNSVESLTVPAREGERVLASNSKMSNADRMAAYTRSRTAMEQSSVAAMSADHAGEGEHVQSTVTVTTGAPPSPISSKALTRYMSRGPRRFPNAMRGGAATRGDVGVTKTSTVCDRADSDHIIEEAGLKARVRGMNGNIVIPMDDPSQSVRFSPDNPNSTVTPACGVGFGDSIY